MLSIPASIDTRLKYGALYPYFAAKYCGFGLMVYRCLFPCPSTSGTLNFAQMIRVHVRDMDKQVAWTGVPTCDLLA